MSNFILLQTDYLFSGPQFCHHRAVYDGYRIWRNNCAILFLGFSWCPELQKWWGAKKGEFSYTSVK